eukprot:gene7536-biopygen22546
MPAIPEFWMSGFYAVGRIVLSVFSGSWGKHFSQAWACTPAPHTPLTQRPSCLHHCRACAPRDDAAVAGAADARLQNRAQGTGQRELAGPGHAAGQQPPLPGNRARQHGARHQYSSESTKSCDFEPITKQERHLGIYSQLYRHQWSGRQEPSSPHNTSQLQRISCPAHQYLPTPAASHASQCIPSRVPGGPHRRSPPLRGARAGHGTLYRLGGMPLPCVAWICCDPPVRASAMGQQWKPMEHNADSKPLTILEGYVRDLRRVFTHFFIFCAMLVQHWAAW